MAHSSVGNSEFNFSFAQNHMPATLRCQARITAATGSLGSSADWLGLVLASSQLRLANAIQSTGA